MVYHSGDRYRTASFIKTKIRWNVHPVAAFVGRIVYDTLYVPMPTFVEVTYEIKMIAEFQQQMNQIISSMMGRRSGLSFIVKARSGDEKITGTFLKPSFVSQKTFRSSFIKLKRA